MAASKPPSSQARAGHWKTAALIILAILAIMVIAMRIEGRVWWCDCRTFRVWIGDVWTSHCSQHLFDPYSLTHFSHGLIFFSVLALLAPRMSMAWRLCIAIGIAAGWEILENSPLIINRYRTATMSLDYLGDSVVNAVGDVMCCFAGFFVARWLGWWKTLALFLALEIALVIWIRDSLLLSTFMLISPIEAIKTWQSSGH
jgi:hypothetical protein